MVFFADASSTSGLAWVTLSDGAVTNGTYNALTSTFTASAGGGGSDAPYTLNVTETIGGLTPGTHTGTDQYFITKMAMKYQAPGFNTFQIQGTGNQDVEVGTSFGAGFKSFTWNTSNSANVTPNSITIRDVTANATLATGEANDGTASLSTAGFSATTPGEVRRYRIAATNTQSGGFSADIVYNAYYRVFYGSVASSSTTSTQVRSLDSFLAGGGSTFVLNTGSSNTIFEVHLPPGRSLVSVVDLDALNKDITAEYLSSSQSVNDAAGTARTYTTRRKTQAVAYTTNHRHQVTIG
jgi:hypothetical protein